MLTNFLPQLSASQPQTDDPNIIPINTTCKARHRMMSSAQTTYYSQQHLLVYSQVAAVPNVSQHWPSMIWPNVPQHWPSIGLMPQHWPRTGLVQQHWPSGQGNGFECKCSSLKHCQASIDTSSQGELIDQSASPLFFNFYKIQDRQYNCSY